MNLHQYNLIKKSVAEFNIWRERNRKMTVDLSGADLSGMKLDEVDLSEALLQNANFSNSSLVLANFSQANISNCNFSRARLKYANLVGVVADSSLFLKADMFKAQMKYGFWDRADFSGASLIRADLAESRFSDANFCGTNTWFANIPGHLKKSGWKEPYRDNQYFAMDYGSSIYPFLIKRGVLLAISLVLVISGVFGYNFIVKKFGDPDKKISAQINYAIANSYLRSEKFDMAIKHYKIAISKDPKMVICYYQIAQAYDCLGKTAEAEKYFNKFKKLRPDSKKLDEMKVIMKKE